MKPTKNGSGQYLQFTFVILDNGPYPVVILDEAQPAEQKPDVGRNRAARTVRDLPGSRCTVPK
jgi:hypothetical protein